MARAVTLGTKRLGGSVAARFGVAVGCLLLAACAGGGKDRNYSLPPGTEFDRVRSDKVLVVVESHNKCGGDTPCVPVVGPCSLGQGNTRGVALYRLGDTGLLFGDPKRGAIAEQLIATDDNPRRVVAHPKDPSIVYVATNLHVQVIKLNPNGGSKCINETLNDQDVKPDANDADYVDMVIDPAIGNGILYVAGRGSNRVDAYTIADDGTLPPLPSSCIVGGGNSQPTGITPMSEGFFMAGGTNDIGVYARIDGQFIAEPDPNATKTPTPVPTVSPTPGPDSTPNPSDPSPETTTCVNANRVSTPLSSIGAALVTDLLFAPSASAPLGEIFVAEEASQRIFTFAVDADGVINTDDSTDTKRAGVYQRMLPHRHSGISILYASVFNEGRVDVFQLENGLLPDQSFSRTAEDPNTLPVGLAIDEPGGTIIYVTQGGLNRVDGFRIQPNGGLPDEPATSTAPPTNALGQDLTTFPDDLVIVPLP